MGFLVAINSMVVPSLFQTIVWVVPSIQVDSFRRWIFTGGGWNWEGGPLKFPSGQILKKIANLDFPEIAGVPSNSPIRYLLGAQNSCDVDQMPHDMTVWPHQDWPMTPRRVSRVPWAVLRLKTVDHFGLQGEWPAKRWGWKARKAWGFPIDRHKWRKNGAPIKWPKINWVTGVKEMEAALFRFVNVGPAVPQNNLCDKKPTINQNPPCLVNFPPQKKKKNT